jgi:hypothetical protein
MNEEYCSEIEESKEQTYQMTSEEVDDLFFDAMDDLNLVRKSEVV